MPYRRANFASDEYYHIYNRGNNKGKIFFERENYLFFLRTFLKYFPQNAAEIHAFCLMPNHYHFLIRLSQALDISVRMKCFGISYSKAVNARYGRSGHLFQGRYNAKHIDSNEYLLHLTRYIHLNPLFAKLVTRPEDWEFSSYRNYLYQSDSRNLKDFGNLVVTKEILSQFSDIAEYKEFVESFAEEKLKEIEETMW